MQKLALSAVVLGWFHANEERLPRWLLTLGTFAFSIYFLHAAILVTFERSLSRLAPSLNTAPWTFITGFVLLVASITLSLMLSALVRWALGKRSRMLLGA